MRKILVIGIFTSIMLLDISAQKSSISLLYLYRSTNNGHGTGLQASTNIGKNFCLLSDIGYFFKKLKVTHYDQTLTQAFTANVDIAYNSRLNQAFILSPLIGVGYFQEFNETRLHSPGSSYGGPVFPTHYKFNPSSVMLNIGTNLTYNYDKNWCCKVGYKLMFAYQKFNPFLKFETGVGYRF